MTAVEIVSLFFVMVSLAAIPSVSVALVVTRSAVLGVGNGVAVAMGIVLADLAFVGLAIGGLAVLAETLGSVFVVIKWLGALYLLWLGVSLWRQPQTTVNVAPASTPAKPATRWRSYLASFLAGFALTLGDVKAIVFYLSLLPLFIDLTTLRTGDVLVVLLITVLSVGGVKMLYALIARRVATAASSRLRGIARKLAGGALVGAGGYMLVKP